MGFYLQRFIENMKWYEYRIRYFNIDKIGREF